MKTASPNGYDYFTCHVNFDNNDDYQKECIELLKKVGRKKNRFLTCIMHAFLSSFKDPSSITKEDIYRWIDYFEFNSRMTEKSMFNSFPAPEAANVISPPPKPVETSTNIPIIKEEPAEIEEMEPINNALLDATNMFSAN